MRLVFAVLLIVLAAPFARAADDAATTEFKQVFAEYNVLARKNRYEEAIDLYDTAARRWEDHPASLVALVQIVNARCELGQYEEAKVANDHALWQLERIPEEKFDSQTLPMTRHLATLKPDEATIFTLGKPALSSCSRMW